jgi:predicted GTPase
MTTSVPADFKYRLYKLELKPDDVVVVELHSPFSAAVVKTIKEWVKETIPEARVICTHDGCILSGSESIP